MSTLINRDQGRRQWGADHHQNPMPASPRPAGEATLALGRAAVVLTVGIWVALVISVLTSQISGPSANHASALQTIVFLIVVTLLAASATAYLVARLGFYYRTREHQRVPRAMLDEFYAARAPALTVLVPSYQEEPDVIRMTLLSAALQEYPNKRVVLLIDDPPDPPYAQPYRLLSAARALPGQITALLAEPRDRFDDALGQCETRHDPDAAVTAGSSPSSPATTTTRRSGCGGSPWGTAASITTSGSSGRTCSGSWSQTSASRPARFAARQPTIRRSSRARA